MPLVSGAVRGISAPVRGHHDLLDGRAVIDEQHLATLADAEMRRLAGDFAEGLEMLVADADEHAAPLVVPRHPPDRGTEHVGLAGVGIGRKPRRFRVLASRNTLLWLMPSRSVSWASAPPAPATWRLLRESSTRDRRSGPTASRVRPFSHDGRRATPLSDMVTPRTIVCAGGAISPVREHSAALTGVGRARGGDRVRCGVGAQVAEGILDARQRMPDERRRHERFGHVSDRRVEDAPAAVNARIHDTG